MTEVAFHFNAPDKLAYACRLLRKAVGGAARVVVTADPVRLRKLDALLWTFSQTDFLPHVLLPGEPGVVAMSPVVLCDSLSAELPHSQVLLNLGDLVPTGYEQFERVIEVVGLDEADRQLARGRWRQYGDGGHTIVRHDLKLKESV